MAPITQLRPNDTRSSHTLYAKHGCELSGCQSSGFQSPVRRFESHSVDDSGGPACLAVLGRPEAIWAAIPIGLLRVFSRVNTFCGGGNSLHNRVFVAGIKSSEAKAADLK